MEDQKLNKFVVPGAIIIAGLIIAGALIYDRKPSVPTDTGKNQPAAIGQNQPSGEPSPTADPAENIKPVTENDHIIGSPNAPLTLILFTDLECPFCKRFHDTMKQVMNEYGKTGKLKWVFRNFPLEQLHSKAKNEAIATECAADIGGNEKFWQYVDRLFEITPSNNGLDPSELPKIAEYIGLDKKQFESCLASGKFNQRIEENIKNAAESSIMGTPFSIVIGPNGKKSVIPGALPYSDVKKIIDEALAGQ